MNIIICSSPAILRLVGVDHFLERVEDHLFGCRMRNLARPSTGKNGERLKRDWWAKGLKSLLPKPVSVLYSKTYCPLVKRTGARAESNRWILRVTMKLASVASFFPPVLAPTCLVEHWPRSRRSDRLHFLSRGPPPRVTDGQS